jgi:hypothetical protein
LLLWGVNLNYFYCCGKLEKVSLVLEIEDSNCEGKSNKKCCDNKQVTVKLNVDQLNNDNALSDLATPLPQPIFYTDNSYASYFSSYSNLNPFYKNNLPDNFASRQILYCVFRL